MTERNLEIKTGMLIDVTIGTNPTPWTRASPLIYGVLLVARRPESRFEKGS